MTTSPGREETMPGWRHWAAFASLVVYAGAASATNWTTLAGVNFYSLAIAAAAAVGLRSRSVLTQVLSQGLAWFWLVESSLDVARQLLGLSNVIEPPGEIAAHVVAVLASAAAIAFARPALGTREARAAFNPLAYRRLFLAGATASMVAAATSADLASTAWFWSPQSPWVPACLAMAASFLAAAIGVVRMRAWGVLLGGASAAVATVLALWSDSWAVSAAVVAIAATPCLFLGLPLLASRLRGGTRGQDRSPVAVRVEAPAPDIAKGDVQGQKEARVEDAALDEEEEDEQGAAVPSKARLGER